MISKGKSDDNKGKSGAAVNSHQVENAQTANEIPGDSDSNHPKHNKNTAVNDAKGLGQLPSDSNSETENGVTSEHSQTISEAPYDTQLIDSPFAAQSTNTANTASSRDELLDKVSSPEELHTILTKFKSFIEDTSINSVVNSSLGKVNTAPTSSYAVSYSWEPANIIMREEHSILMLKFTDAAGNIIKNSNIEYDILIKDPNTNNVVFQKHGSTPTGVDLKIIDGNLFPIGASPINTVNYNIEIDVNNVGGNTVTEHASLPKVAVISYNP